MTGKKRERLFSPHIIIKKKNCHKKIKYMLKAVMKLLLLKLAQQWKPGGQMRCMHGTYKTNRCINYKRINAMYTSYLHEKERGKVHQGI